MNIVSLYKIWSGHEFLVPSIESNYFRVKKLVFVSSPRGWNGEYGNTTLEPLKMWKQKYDRFNKIVILEYDTTNQEDQYKHGFDYIKKNFTDCDWIQIVDSDEVWDDSSWGWSLNFLNSNISVPLNAVTCNMWSYVKSQFYRAIGNGEVCPVVFVRPSARAEGARYYHVSPKGHMNNVWVHHFVLVRDTYESVFKKLHTSIIGDNNLDRLGDIEKWKREVWDTLPNGRVYHYIKNHEHLWSGVLIIGPEDLPECCRSLKFNV